jgi:trans-aconitate 2-methyltransferase
MDDSPEMLAKAREALPQREFEEADLAQWHGGQGADLLFSNATFQWVSGHLEVLRRLLTGLKHGGVLAVQMPDNLGEPSHVAMIAARHNAPYADKLTGASEARDLLPEPAHYYAALKPLCARLDVWHSIYSHPLDGISGIVEWLKGTGLRPFLAPLTPVEQSDYLQLYMAQLAKVYPLQADGKALLRFPRLFMVAVK